MTSNARRNLGCLIAFIVTALCTSPFWGPILLVLSLVTFFGYTAPRSNTPFPEAHQRAVNTFVDSAGFGFGRLKKGTHWQEHSVIFEGTRYRPDQFHLIGLTPDLGDRYFEGWMPKKEAIARTAHRQPSPEEASAIAQLRAGSSWARLPAPLSREYDGERKQIRVIAPVFAQPSCLACHPVKTGALLGAFDYWLVDASEKEEKTPSGAQAGKASSSISDPAP